MSHIIPGIVVLAGAAASANAAFISFASDTDPDNPTLVANFVEQAQNTLVADFTPTFVDLVIDPDEDGPDGPYSVAAQLQVQMTLDYVGSQTIVPGLATHVFALVGSFTFMQADFARGEVQDGWVLNGTISAGEAVFAGLGTDDKVGSASMTGFDITYDLDNVPFLGSSEGLSGDFGFTLTDINDGEGANLTFGFDAERGENVITGIDSFDSESSFSGRIVPTPGTCALIGAAGLGFTRRRRTA